MRTLPSLFVTSFLSLCFPLRRVEKREGARDGVAVGGSQPVLNRPRQCLRTWDADQLVVFQGQYMGR